MTPNSDDSATADALLDSAAFAALLDYVRSSRGVNLTGYKQASLMRRVIRRMQAIEVSNFGDYIDYLEVHPDEFQHLFNTLLSNVTAFFRDSHSWDAIRDEVLPAILSTKTDADPIRIWSAGCASGEEAYSIAMLLAERLGLEQFQSRVKIYATDLDKEALAQRDMGRPLQDLELSYRPVELRSCLDEAYEHRRTVKLVDVAWQNFQGEAIFLEVQITPLFNPDSQILGAAVSFVDVTDSKRLQKKLEHANQELEMAYEELQSANEELETTNEELQSTNEELETTNEELQSTNEELETMNEELQTVNDEFQRSSDELNQTNLFLESVFTSLKGGVVVVNRDLQVQIWNIKAQDLWGLRPEEVVGQYFLNLDFGLPVEQLRQPVRDCLASADNGTTELTLEAVSRKGRTLSCHVTCTPLINTKKQVQGVILTME